MGCAAGSGTVRVGFLEDAWDLLITSCLGLLKVLFLLELGVRDGVGLLCSELD